MSADISLFKDPFIQSGESCQISSCAFVHEYYSNLFKRQTRNVPDIFGSYIEYIEECSTSAMQGSYDVTKDKDLKAKLGSLSGLDYSGNERLYEDMIHDIYFSYCGSRTPDLRGACHMSDFHNDCLNKQNKLYKASGFSQVTDITTIENHLKKNRNTLAMLLINNANHWVVAGWDDKGLFLRNPNDNKPSHISGSISSIGVSEYILFEEI